MRGEAILDLVELREHASSNKLNIYSFLFYSLTDNEFN